MPGIYATLACVRVCVCVLAGVLACVFSLRSGQQADGVTASATTCCPRTDRRQYVGVTNVYNTVQDEKTPGINDGA